MCVKRTAVTASRSDSCTSHSPWKRLHRTEGSAFPTVEQAWATGLVRCSGLAFANAPARRPDRVLSSPGCVRRARAEVADQGLQHRWRTRTFHRPCVAAADLGNSVPVECRHCPSPRDWCAGHHVGGRRRAALLAEGGEQSLPSRPSDRVLQAWPRITEDALVTPKESRGSVGRSLVFALLGLWIAATGGLFIVAIATATPSENTPDCDWPSRSGDFCSNPSLMNAAFIVGSAGLILLAVSNEVSMRGDESRLLRYARAMRRLVRGRRGRH